MSRVYTVGHSSRSIEELVALLRAHGIGRVVDVRRYPGSRRFPHFAREALRAHLGEAGIAYEHVPELGGRRRPAEGSPNGWWENDSFRAYADHTATEEFARGLERLLAGADQSPTAVMCAEAVPWRCHRQLIADVLVARGHEVRHAMSTDRSDAHELGAGARPQPDGTVIWPATDQLDLFGEGR